MSGSLIELAGRSLPNALVDGANLTVNDPPLSDTVKRKLPGFDKRLYAGRGIIVHSRDVRSFAPIWVCVQLLRHHGYKLPIQVWHKPGEISELMHRLLVTAGVQCVDSGPLLRWHPARLVDQTELRAFAIMHSPFLEVLALDVQYLPLANPEYLSDDSQYLETGCAIWPGHDQPDGLSRDLGPSLVHKERCWLPVALSQWMTQSGDWTRRLERDDALRLACATLRVAYAAPVAGIRVPAGDAIQCDLRGGQLFERCDCLPRWLEWPEALRELQCADLCMRFLEQLEPFRDELTALNENKTYLR
jgi:putative mannosyltransferase